MAASLFVSPHKNKGIFHRPVFIIVINTSCLGVCYRIYARQKFLNNALAPDGTVDYLEFLPGVYPVTNALTISIYSYNQTAVGETVVMVTLS